MNVNDVDMNDGASGSNSDQTTERLSNNPSCNDCGKHFGIAVGGARPKVKHLVCNIPNGIPRMTDDDAAKVNNNVVISKISDGNDDTSNTTNDVPINSIQNGLNSNCSNGLESAHAVDSVLRNNVNCHAVDKCSLATRSCSSKENGMNSLPLNFSATDDHKDLDVNLDRNSPSSSDTGNEGEDGMSADECCIYTYKGDQMADLPSSFFRLDVLAGAELPEAGEAVRNRVEMEENGGNRSRSSSPEMDFLEMDFDPGPSCDQDSEEETDPGEMQEEAAPYPNLVLNDSDNERDLEAAVCQGKKNDLNATEVTNKNSFGNIAVPPRKKSVSSERKNISPEPIASTSRDMSWSIPIPSSSGDISVGNSLFQRTSTSGLPYRDAWGHHCTSGDLCSPCGEGEEQCWGDTLALWNSGTLKIQAEGLLDMRTYNLHSALYHCIMAKRLVLDKQASMNEVDENAEFKFDATSDDFKSPVERVMIWLEQEACVKQVTQISTSACGATAVINVLLALNISFSLDKLKESVATRLRADTAPLPQYLFSRSVAGATHVDIIRGLQLASEGALYARFFHMFPERVVSLTRWLGYWMKKGAIPIATLNLQHGISPGSTVPDAWHHQMVFGVGPRGIYLTNPVECVSEAALWPQLCSPSVLMVKRSDILSRWNENTNLRLLMTHPDSRWKTMNVLGQVVNVIRESMSSRIQTQGRVITQHVNIPASYCSGITLAISREAPAYEELRSAVELPLLQQM